MVIITRNIGHEVSKQGRNGQDVRCVTLFLEICNRQKVKMTETFYPIVPKKDGERGERERERSGGGDDRRR